MHCINRSTVDILKVFQQRGLGLSFTFEALKEGCIQYLDLSVRFGSGKICWMYAPRSVKPLLPFSSGHTKLVKNEIALSCLRSAVTKSCVHLMENSFKEQVRKLRQAGFPEAVLSWACEKLVKLVKSGTKKEVAEEVAETKRNIAVIPNVHGITHRLKRVGSRYGVQVAITARNKLRSICARVASRASGGPGRQSVGCKVKHDNHYVSCAEDR